jgi:hypothetical protein
MGYALSKVGKGRTVAVGCQEDAGTNEGKGNGAGQAGPLLNMQCHGQRRGQRALPSLPCCVLPLYMSPSLCLVIYRIVDCYFVIVTIVIRRCCQVVSPVVVIIVTVVVRRSRRVVSPVAPPSAPPPPRDNCQLFQDDCCFLLLPGLHQRRW